MPVAKLSLEIDIGYARSLKDRRQVVRSIRDTLRHGFNLSIAEIDEGLVWNRASLAAVAINRSTPYLLGQMEQAERAARRAAARFGAEIVDAWLDMLPDLPTGDLDPIEPASTVDLKVQRGEEDV